MNQDVEGQSSSNRGWSQHTQAQVHLTPSHPRIPANSFFANGASGCALQGNGTSSVNNCISPQHCVMPLEVTRKLCNADLETRCIGDNISIEGLGSSNILHNDNQHFINFKKNGLDSAHDSRENVLRCDNLEGVTNCDAVDIQRKNIALPKTNFLSVAKSNSIEGINISSDNAGSCDDPQLLEASSSFTDRIQNNLSNWSTDVHNFKDSNSLCLANNGNITALESLTTDCKNIGSVSKWNNVNSSLDVLYSSTSFGTSPNKKNAITSNCTEIVNKKDCDNVMNKTNSQGNVNKCENFTESNFNQCKLLKDFTQTNVNIHNSETVSDTVCNVNGFQPSIDESELKCINSIQNINYDTSQIRNTSPKVSHSSENYSSEPSFKSESLEDSCYSSRTKQRRKSRKPLKSTIMYLHNTSSSSPPFPASNMAVTQLSPPSTLGSPPPAPHSCTPPVVIQPPLSPPLSDVQSNLSSLSPCSSVNSDETKCVRAPLPKLLPISCSAVTSVVSSTDTSASFQLDSVSAVTPYSIPSKVSKYDGYLGNSGSPITNNGETQSSSSISLGDVDLPPPPPYPKEKISNSECDKDNSGDIPNKSLSSSENNVSIELMKRPSSNGSVGERQCNGELLSESRPPPPPYHSHFFNNKNTDKLTSNLNSNNTKNFSDQSSFESQSLSSLDDGFWSSVHLPSTLSVSPVPPVSKSDNPNKFKSICARSAVLEPKTDNLRLQCPNGNDGTFKTLSAVTSFCSSGLHSNKDDSLSQSLSSIASKNKLSGSLNGSSLPNYYSTATVALLLQQLAAARRKCDGDEHNLVDYDHFDDETEDGEVRRFVGKNAKVATPNRSPLTSSTEVKDSFCDDSVKSGFRAAGFHEHEDSAGGVKQTAEHLPDEEESARLEGSTEEAKVIDVDKLCSDKKPSNTINIDIDKTSLSSILSCLITKSSESETAISSTQSSSGGCSTHNSLALQALTSCVNSAQATSALSKQLSSETNSTETSTGISPFFKSSQLLSQLATPLVSPALTSPSLMPRLDSSSSPTLSTTLPSDTSRAGDHKKSASPSLSLASAGLFLPKQPDSDESESVPPSSHMTALLAAALQNSYGMSSVMMESPLSRLLMGNSSASSDFSAYASLCGSNTNASTNAFPDLSGLAGCSYSSASMAHDDERKGDSTIDKSSLYQKALQECSSMNSLNNMATLNYLLQQQQQLESVGLNSNSGGNSASINGLAALNTLNSLAGLSSLPPSLTSDGLLPLHQTLKKMRYSDGSPSTKRKPRSSNHTKSFHCSLCSKRFSLKDELEEHMLTHTSDELGNESYMQKSFACSECSFRTKYKFCLQRHMHIHSGEKPLVCPYCRYRSISKVSYDNHIRTHTGEKPFACPYCSYKSSFKNNLTKHIKTHTGSSKPYTCNKCSSCFTSQMQLKSHMRLHLDPTGTHSCSQCLYTCMSRFELECHMRTHVPM